MRGSGLARGVALRLQRRRQQGRNARRQHRHGCSFNRSILLAWSEQRRTGSARIAITVSERAECGRIAVTVSERAECGRIAVTVSERAETGCIRKAVRFAAA
ncbi:MULTISPECIES: hypothetical protein [unclassified Paenibacillus]|uniref:hypothetical protein n=1 Tax=unclassified Paenibacillus TaxID=185978 RepID=UPI0009564A7E|nr:MULTISPECIES: hypothetical protein [unclassified Paenibacillus]ASS65528.1 hypothetical protein CIC07_04835 [Paenibacillus sp. RUD330]SIQ33109.1 hypothetical protein SAMN05880555_1395 [Paenibacillus sp. RU4X]SIQ54733.1 hypothetical protein SAMN05880570_1393 [Paenibacillus sp. RU4T]